MRKTLLAVALLVLLGQASADSGIDSKIVNECPADYEPVISMDAPNKTYSHPGPPDFFKHNLCVKGIKDSGIKSSCTDNEVFYIHSNETEYAHFSHSGGYNIPVCADRMVTQVRDSCMENQTSIMSVSSDHNAHVARLGILDKELCGFYQEPKNVTLEMEFNLTSSDTVIADGDEIGDEEIFLAEFPYIVSEGAGYVSGIVADDMIRMERRIGQENTLVMERSEGEFILPFTSGGSEDIEDRQDSILDSDLISQVSPSFGFYIPEEPKLKVTLDPRDVELNSGLSIQEGSYSINITKSGEDSVTIERGDQ